MSIEQTIVNQNLTKRIQIIKKISNEVDKHYIFEETLNFTFLYHLYSQILEDLYNYIDNYTENEFKEKYSMLNQIVKRIKPFVIE